MEVRFTSKVKHDFLDIFTYLACSVAFRTQFSRDSLVLPLRRNYQITDNTIVMVAHEPPCIRTLSAAGRIERSPHVPFLSIITLRAELAALFLNTVLSSRRLRGKGINVEVC